MFMDSQNVMWCHNSLHVFILKIQMLKKKLLLGLLQLFKIVFFPTFCLFLQTMYTRSNAVYNEIRSPDSSTKYICETTYNAATSSEDYSS